MKQKITVWMGLLVGVALTGRASYVDEVSADAPEAMYRFRESAGATTLTDASGNGHAGTVLSNVTFGATGPVDSSAVFSSGTVNLDLQLDPSAGDFSIEAVIRFDASGQSRAIFQQENGDGNGRTVFYRTSGGYLRSYLGGSATTSSGTVPDGEWHHIAMTVEENGSNDVIRFYIDGEAAGSGTNDVESANGDWRLGNGNLIGAIDELAVYSQMLSADRIQAHYEACSAVHYVSPSGSSVWPYSTWETAATRIQDAVNAAVDGDTVLVTNGTYTSGGQITVSKDISIRSVNGPNLTIVDGRNAHRGLNLGNTESVLSGFTIKNGNASGVADSDRIGGGVFCSSPLPVIRNCFFVKNSAANRGGGSYGGTLIQCTLRGNSAGEEGGGSCGSTLQHCRLVDNQTARHDSSRGGGSCYGILEHCSLVRNSANTGGGSYDGTLSHCTLSGNEADYGGGSYGGELNHCTITGNQAVKGGGGSYGSSLENCIIWRNFASYSGNVYNVSIRYSCCEGGADGLGNIRQNPRFADLMGHLLPSSPCIDAGTSISGLTQDPDGTPVPLDGNADGSAIPDMGAYEYASYAVDSDGDSLSDGMEAYSYGANPACTDSDGDGRADGDEVAAGTSPVYDEAEVITAIAADPVTHGLYTSNSIVSLSNGALMRQTSNGWVHLNLQLEQCTNLVDGVWLGVGAGINWQIEAPEDKMFYRVKGSQ